MRCRTVALCKCVFLVLTGVAWMRQTDRPAGSCRDVERRSVAGVVGAESRLGGCRLDGSARICPSGNQFALDRLHNDAVGEEGAEGGALPHHVSLDRR